MRVGRGIPASGTDTAGLDKNWALYVLSAKAVGFRVGGYWRFFPLPDFTWQVNSFCDRLTSVPLQLPPLVDIEDAQELGQAELTDWAIRVLTGVERATGKVPLLYTNRSFLNTRVDATRLTRWPLALARWTLEPAWPVEQPVFWQYTGNSRVPWATGPVDLQRAH